MDCKCKEFQQSVYVKWKFFLANQDKSWVAVTFPNYEGFADVFPSCFDVIHAKAPKLAAMKYTHTGMVLWIEGGQIPQLQGFQDYYAEYKKAKLYQMKGQLEDTNYENNKHIAYTENGARRVVSFLKNTVGSRKLWEERYPYKESHKLDFLKFRPVFDRIKSSRGPDMRDNPRVYACAEYETRRTAQIDHHNERKRLETLEQGKNITAHKVRGGNCFPPKKWNWSKLKRAVDKLPVG